MKNTKLSKNPLTRLGWHKHYTAKFNKNKNNQAAHLANWYLLLHLAFEE